MKYIRITMLIVIFLSVPGVTLAGSGKSFYQMSYAARAGDAQAQFELAEMYYRGIGIERSNSQALFWYQKAAENGNADAQVVMSLMHYFGVGENPQDPARAYAWADIAARQGRINARNMADDILKELNAIEAEKARTLAQKYYKLYVEPFQKIENGTEEAAQNRAADSQHEAKTAVTKKNEIERNYVKEGLTYLQRAKNGDPNAQVALSLLYSSASTPGYTSDDIQAYAWAIAAARQGNSSARGIANDIMKKLDSEDAEKAKVLAQEYARLYAKPLKKNGEGQK